MIKSHKQAIQMAAPEALEVLNGQDGGALFENAVAQIQKTHGIEFSSQEEAALAIIDLASK